MESWRAILDQFPDPLEAPVGSGAGPLNLDPPPRVVLFDVYGTLVHTLAGDLDQQARERGALESFVITARRFGFSEDTGKLWQRRFFERIREEHRFCAEQGIARAEVLVDHIWRDLILDSGGDPRRTPPRDVCIHRELAANPVAAYEGAAEAVRGLKEAGCQVGLVSNAQFYTLPIIGRRLGIRAEELFDPRWTFLSYRLGFAKPDAHFFRLVRTTALRAGIAPGDVLVVGNDPVNDIMAARLHGLRAVLFNPAVSSPAGPAGDEEPCLRDHRSLLPAG